jgi:putative FmdB family regulatory protein
MKRIFEFACEEGHITEALKDDSERVITCPQCGKEAVRIVSAPQVKLEGFTGAFPDAYDRWSRVRAEKLKQEKKQNS